MKQAQKTDVYCRQCNAHSEVPSEQFNGFMPQHTKTGASSLCHGGGLKPKLVVTTEDRERYAQSGAV